MNIFILTVSESLLQETWIKITSKKSGAPSLVIANSVKGKGVSFMEDNFNWHHGGIDDTKLASALSELRI
jgi:transketolase